MSVPKTYDQFLSELTALADNSASSSGFTSSGLANHASHYQSAAAQYKNSSAWSNLSGDQQAALQAQWVYSMNSENVHGLSKLEIGTQASEASKMLNAK